MGSSSSQISRVSWPLWCWPILNSKLHFPPHWKRPLEYYIPRLKLCRTFALVQVRLLLSCDRYHPEQTWSISGKLSLLWSKYDCMMHNTGEKHAFLPYLSTHIQMSMSHYKPMFRTSRIADKAMTGSGCIHIHPKAPRHSYFISRLSSDALSECIAKYFLEVTGKHESMAKCHAKCKSAC